MAPLSIPVEPHERERRQAAAPKRSVDPWRTLLHNHGLPFGAYALLAVALSWPIVRDFTTRIAGDGGADPRHNIWLLWHTLRALLGQAPLYHAPELYYPLGVSLLTHGLGPVNGLLALPFWPWGAQAAYNGTLLLGITLSGYCMYLLARDLGFSRRVAFFAGLVLLAAPITLAGLLEHMDKTFLGMLPLALLVLLRALNPDRSWRWAPLTAVVLLLAYMVTGWQFVMGALAIAYFCLLALWQAGRSERLIVLRRILLIGVSCAVLIGPLLLAVLQASRTPGITVDVSAESVELQPDALESILPSQFSRFFSAGPNAWLQAAGSERGIETAVSLAYTGLLLCLVALLARVPRSGRWLALTLIFIILSMGPVLKLAGQREFTTAHLSIPLPYAVLTELPGLGFMRTPGRLMKMGFVAFGISAAYGLAWLEQRFPRRAGLIVAAAVALLLLEAWPMPWPQETLRPIPAFYTQIATDPDMYGVFDLPHKNRPNSNGVLYAAHAMWYQTVHHKGIASGYLSRTFSTHPFFPCLYQPAPVDPLVRVNGAPSNCLVNAQADLARHNYRYVVWHTAREEYDDNKPGSRAERIARDFVAAAFPNQTPIQEDDLARVYAIDPAAPTHLALRLGAGWYNDEEDARWARSPATLRIISPQAQLARLVLHVSALHDPDAPTGSGRAGRLLVQAGGQTVVVDVTTDTPVSVPLALTPGEQAVTLSLAAGNFRPSDYGQNDDRLLSFAVRLFDLQAP